ncbi:MAG: SlyX family protein [Treponema sp.]|jgi:SlyX protein|nr:SlyX family protein [Treponema sp.]
MEQEILGSRLEKIEMKLAFLEDFIARLQDEVVARNAVMDVLKTEHAAMKEKLLQISRNMEEIPNQKPPHY